MKSANASQAQIIQAQTVYAQSIANLTQQLKAAEKQVSEAGGKFAAMSQGLVQLGYAADDAQYGMKGLANNIQPLLMSLGLGAGLAGIIGIVVTATVVLTEKWDRLMSAMGMGRAKTQAEEMDELAKATERTVEQTARLEDYQRRQAAADSLKGGRPKAQAEQEQATREAINEAGGLDRLTAGMTAVRSKGLGGLNPLAEGYSEFQSAKEQFDNPARFATRTAAGTVGNTAEVREKALAAMNRARDKNRTDTQKQIKDLMAKAVAGDTAAFGALMGEVRNNPGAFPPDALKQLQQGAPEAVHGRKIQGLMNDINSDMEKFEKRKQELSEYFGNVTPGPDAETQAFLDKRNRDEGIAIRRDQQVQRNRNQERAQQLRESGSFDPIRDAMMGILAGGGTAGQVEAKAVRMLMDQGLSVEEAQKQARGMMRDNSKTPAQAAQEMMDRLGPRQLHGLAEMKDAVQTSGANDPLRKQLEEQTRSRTILEQMYQLFQDRTFGGVAT